MITLNDVLITLKQYLDNQWSGFDCSLDACKNPDEKIDFLKKCMALVLEGNFDKICKICNKPANDFESQTNNSKEELKEDELFSPNDFFTDTAKKFFINPEEMYPNRKLIEQDKQVILLFAKLIILKKVYDSCKKDSTLLNQDLCDQIEMANEILHKAYSSLANNFKQEPIIFNGTVIENLDQINIVKEKLNKDLGQTIHEIIQNRQRINQVKDNNTNNMNYAAKFFGLVLGLVLVNTMRKEDERFLSDVTQTSLLLIAGLAFLFIIATTIRNIMADFEYERYGLYGLFGQAHEQYKQNHQHLRNIEAGLARQQQPLIEDQAIQKHIILTSKDIAELKEMISSKVTISQITYSCN